MRELLIRCSSLGKIMTSPTAAAIKAGEVLSEGAKTYLRGLVAQEIFGVDFDSTRHTYRRLLRLPSARCRAAVGRGGGRRASGEMSYSTSCIAGYRIF